MEKRGCRGLPGSAAAVWLMGGLVLALSLLAGLHWGVLPVSWGDMFLWLRGKASPDTALVLESLRLPRVLMAANAGAVLSLGGLAMQTVLRNPLAEPYILGLSGGAAVGVVSGLLLGLSTLALQGCAFAGSLLTLALLFLLGARSRSGLLLSGVMLNAFCGAAILFLLSLAGESQASAALFWSMGDLGRCDMKTAMWVSLSLVPCFLFFLLSGHTMNLLLLGEESAQSLGVPVRRATLILLLLTSLMTSVIVAAVGPLGFVGLVMPQALRLLFGQDHRLLVPGCLLFGASFLIGCDLLSRALPVQSELPAGVVTAMIGAPLFVLLLRRQL